ncbi:MAG TPA: hypothetical protein VFU80_08945, partial [Sphingomicrobium sp.]|nr:hypothetical protein [Sphingomicrobium sp.]
ATAALAWWRLTTAFLPPRQISPKRLLLLGIAAFVLGHAMFVILPDYILFSPSGIANRLLVPGAIGAAIILASVGGMIAGAISASRRQGIFAILVALIAFAAVARLEQLEQYWAEAPSRQSAVLAAAKTDLKDLPTGSTVILDGVCPYHGPAIVFESYWEITGALSHALGRPINGEAVSPRMSLTSGGLKTSIYGDPRLYAYGPTLFAYNPALGLVVPLTDAAASQRYFSREDRRSISCEWGTVGHGVLV